MLAIELLQVALGNRSALSRVPSDQEWEQIYRLANEQAIVGVMFDGVEHLPKQQRPDVNLLMKWYGQTEYLAAQNELLDTRSREITDIFTTAGIHSCILKGQGVARLYPHPGRRCGGDIDLWIDLPRQSALQFVRDRWSVGDVLMYHVDAKVFNDVSVELHYMPAVSYNPWRYRKYKRYFSQETMVQMQRVDNTLGFAHPSITFHAVYSMIHIFNHALNNEIKLKQIVDYYYILQHMSASDKTKVMLTLDDMGLRSITGAMMYALEKLVGFNTGDMLCTPKEKTGMKLLHDIMEGHTSWTRPRNENSPKTFKTKTLKLIENINMYPSEVLWAPVWKLWHYVWREMHK